MRSGLRACERSKQSSLGRAPPPDCRRIRRLGSQESYTSIQINMVLVSLAAQTSLNSDCSASWEPETNVRHPLDSYRDKFLSQMFGRIEEATAEQAGGYCVGVKRGKIAHSRAGVCIRGVEYETSRCCCFNGRVFANVLHYGGWVFERGRLVHLAGRAGGSADRHRRPAACAQKAGIARPAHLART